MRRCGLFPVAIALIAFACAGLATANAGATMSGLNSDLGRGGSGLAVSVASKCITIGGKRICLEDDNAKNKDADDEDPARSAPRRTAIAPKTRNSSVSKDA